jgi:hypothetical protein
MYKLLESLETLNPLWNDPLKEIVDLIFIAGGELKCKYKRGVFTLWKQERRFRGFALNDFVAIVTIFGLDAFLQGPKFLQDVHANEDEDLKMTIRLLFSTNIKHAMGFGTRKQPLISGRNGPTTS